MPVGDPAFGEIVRRHFEGDSVAGQDPDAVAAEFTGEMRQHSALLIELNVKETAGKFFNDGTGNLNAVFLTHCRLFMAFRSSHSIRRAAYFLG